VGGIVAESVVTVEFIAQGRPDSPPTCDRPSEAFDHALHSSCDQNPVPIHAKPAATINSQGPSNPEELSNLRSSFSISCHAASFAG